MIVVFRWTCEGNLQRLRLFLHSHVNYAVRVLENFLCPNVASIPDVEDWGQLELISFCEGFGKFGYHFRRSSGLSTLTTTLLHQKLTRATRTARRTLFSIRHLKRRSMSSSSTQKHVPSSKTINMARALILIIEQALCFDRWTRFNLIRINHWTKIRQSSRRRRFPLGFHHSRGKQRQRRH